MQQPPAKAAVAAATWSWKAVRQFVLERCGVRLSPRSCLRYLHRLGFVWKRPKRLLLKADLAKRAAFVETYRTVVTEAQATGARILFVDEAHFRADGDLRGLWTLRGEPALVDSSSPRYGEKASYYSAVCLETGEVAGCRVAGNTNAATTVCFLRRLRERFAGPLVVIWDNGAAHRGPELREYLRTPDLRLRLVALPPYSPDFNPDEAIWKWIRQEVTANTCFGTAEKVAEALAAFWTGVDARAEEVKRRCRSTLQSLAFPVPAHPSSPQRLVDPSM